jgi:hypothetical protein
MIYLLEKRNRGCLMKGILKQCDTKLFRESTPTYAIRNRRDLTLFFSSKPV